MADQAITDFLNESSDFLSFDNSGGVIAGLYTGVALEEDRWNPGKKRMVYSFEIGGKTKKLGSGSTRLAKEFARVDAQPGEFLKITRTGDRFDTQFSIEKSDIPF